MEFTELMAGFAARHNLGNFTAEDGVAALDIDGIVVTIVEAGDVVALNADIGDPPAEGRAQFADLLLEANFQSESFFVKVPERGCYAVMRRMALAALDVEAFDAALEAFVNFSETWRRLLSDFRPVAAAAKGAAGSEGPSLGSSGFMQV